MSARAGSQGLRGRGLLLSALVGLVLVSAGLRLPGLGAALAQAGRDAPPGPACLDEGALELLMADLDDRARRLAQQEAALAARASLVATAEERLSQERAALEAAEARLSEVLAMADRAAERDVARLTAMYESMRPRQAAALFEAMPPPIAAGFLGTMRTDPAAAILALMTPDRAREVSLALAARNARAPRE
ncbi:MAG: hypothetical protein JJU40_01070 [Rhodobacteraceae bacterium]|nr:hypothetical protein [Paracoccaceae bacterium]